MAEAPHTSSDSESDSEEDFGGFWGIVRDSWELLKNRRIRQLFFLTYGILLLINIKYSPQLLETLTRSREEIVAANYIIYNSMIAIHMISFIYVVYLQLCFTFPNRFGVTRGPRQGLQSSSESAGIGSSEWETEESGQYDSEHQQSSPAHQQSSHTHSTVSRAAESVSEIVAPQAELALVAVRPRTRSAARIERENAELARMLPPPPPGRIYVQAELGMSPEGDVIFTDARPVRGVRTRSQSRRQAEPSKLSRRRKPHKRS